MAAEVSCLVNGRDRRNSSEILITRDLLGGLSNSSNGGGRDKKKPDLELHLPPPRPSEWQMDRRRRQEEVNFLQETDHESSSSSNLEDLELKLVPDNNNNNNNPISWSSYTTVCTLDKVKSALQRAENQTINNNKKRRSSMVGIGIGNDNAEQGGGGVMFAAGCPGCLLYVIASKTDPKCPHCNSIVPIPSPLAIPIKKARFDLNASFS